MVKLLLTACDKRNLHGPGLNYLLSAEGRALLATKGTPKKWTVICGTQVDRDDWVASLVNGLEDVIDAKVLVHTEAKKDSHINGPLILDTIVAKAFFDKKWIQDLIKDTVDLVLLDIKPVEHVPDLFPSFQKVLLGKFMSSAAWTQLSPYLPSVSFEQVSSLTNGFYSTVFIGKPDTVMKTNEPVEESKAKASPTPTPTPPTKVSKALTPEQRYKLEHAMDATLTTLYLQLWMTEQSKNVSVVEYMAKVVSETIHQNILTHVVQVPTTETGSVIIGLQMPKNKKDLISLLLMHEIDVMKDEQRDEDGRVVRPPMIHQASIIF